MNQFIHLCETLGDVFYFVYDWGLSEEEMEQFRKEAKDPTLQFITSRTPLLEEDEEEQLFVAMYSDQGNIPEDFLECEIGEAGFVEMAQYALQCAKEVGAPVSLYLDPYTPGDKHWGITMDEIINLMAKKRLGANHENCKTQLL